MHIIHVINSLQQDDISEVIHFPDFSEDYQLRRVKCPSKHIISELRPEAKLGAASGPRKLGADVADWDRHQSPAVLSVLLHRMEMAASMLQGSRAVSGGGCGRWWAGWMTLSCGLIGPHGSDVIIGSLFPLLMV